MRALVHGLAISLLANAAAAVAQSAVTPGGDSAASAPARGLAGSWDAVNRSRGGIGSTMIFSADGVFTLVIGAMVDMKYRADGNRVRLFGEDGGQGFSESQILTFAGDTAVLSSPGSPCTNKLIPIEPSSAPGSLVGKWRFIHMTGVPAYEDFSAAGAVRLRVPMQVHKGTYQATGNTIAFHTMSPRQEDWTARFALNGDELSLKSARGSDRLCAHSL